jgi:hypothetical protein
MECLNQLGDPLCGLAAAGRVRATVGKCRRRGFWLERRGLLPVRICHV